MNSRSQAMTKNETRSHEMFCHLSLERYLNGGRLPKTAYGDDGPNAPDIAFRNLTRFAHGDIKGAICIAYIGKIELITFREKKTNGLFIILNDHSESGKLRTTYIPAATEGWTAAFQTSLNSLLAHYNLSVSENAAAGFHPKEAGRYR